MRHMRELVKIIDDSSYNEFLIRMTEGSDQKELLGETVAIVQ